MWSDEWSGILFYETEGTFGEEDFKVIAQTVFLMDIGSSSYTEYDTGDPALIKFMMQNPTLLKMKKGHIHSHNTMSVFFSGTDDGELVENCGLHNFYVSLIVNNKNEMCAKIAFKATSIVETSTTISFMDQNGKMRNRVLPDKKEKEGIFIYKCSVIKPGFVEEFFKSRFQSIKEDVKTRGNHRKFTESATKDKALQGFNVDSRWKEAGLFDDVKGESVQAKWSREWKEEKEKKTEVEVNTRKGLVIDKSAKTDPRVYTLLTQLLQLDPTYTGTLRAALTKLDNEFYSERDYRDRNKSPKAKGYHDTVANRSIEFYMSIFPEDFNLTGFERTMGTCVEILQTFDMDFYELVSDLSETLNLEIR